MIKSSGPVDWSKKEIPTPHSADPRNESFGLFISWHKLDKVNDYCQLLLKVLELNGFSEWQVLFSNAADVSPVGESF